MNRAGRILLNEWYKRLAFFFFVLMKNRDFVRKAVVVSGVDIDKLALGVRILSQYLYQG